MSTRVWKQLEAASPQAAPTRAAECTLRLALRSCQLDEASPLSDMQRTWLQTRLDAQTPFTPPELAKLVPVLMLWSAGRSWQAAMVEGLRGAVDPALLPSPAEEA